MIIIPPFLWLNPPFQGSHHSRRKLPPLVPFGSTMRPGGASWPRTCFPPSRLRNQKRVRDLGRLKPSLCHPSKQTLSLFKLWLKHIETMNLQYVRVQLAQLQILLWFAQSGTLRAKNQMPQVTPAPKTAGPLHADVAPQLGFGQQRRLGAERVQHRQLRPGHHSCVVQLGASQWPGARRDIMGTSPGYPI